MSHDVGAASAGEVGGPHPVISLVDLRVEYPPSRASRDRAGRGLPVRAVDGVSLDIWPGEVLALVGESGSGKTTIAHALMRLVEPASGRIVHRGRDITGLRGGELRRLRRAFQLIFQDPYESLDPRQSVGEIVAEPLLIHGLGATVDERTAIVQVALESVGLTPAAEFSSRYPHQLSGGQRQRVSIAAAMVLQPELVVADEPVSMLDVSVRAGILRLMLDLRASRGFAYIFITHDLSLAWVLADRIAVLYLGRVVEIGPADDVIHRPRHPYTRALVSVIPVPRPSARHEQVVLVGETPSPSMVPNGCRFHPRCPLRERLGRPEICERVDPVLEPAGGKHAAACHFQLEEKDANQRA
jgi:oligopeptide/dipeptide ABC transporter ATP-binding protein